MAPTGRAACCARSRSAPTAPPPPLPRYPTPRRPGASPPICACRCACSPSLRAGRDHGHGLLRRWHRPVFRRADLRPGCGDRSRPPRRDVGASRHHPSYGGTIAYRRFWTRTLRSTLSYAYAHNDFPDYVAAFTPGSASAVALNREMQQVFLNLIWSPFAEVRDGVFAADGWMSGSNTSSRAATSRAAPWRRGPRRRARHRQPHPVRRHRAVLMWSVRARHPSMPPSPSWLGDCGGREDDTEARSARRNPHSAAPRRGPAGGLRQYPSQRPAAGREVERIAFLGIPNARFWFDAEPEAFGARSS